MQRRVLSVTVLAALLVASGFTAAYLLLTIERHDNQLAAAEEDVAARLVGMGDTMAGIGAAQQSYVAPGQLDEPWFERTSTLVQQLYNDIAALRSRLRAPQSANTLQALAEATDALMAADARTRQNLRLGQDLMAADVIFSDVRNTLDAMAAKLREVRDAERVSYHAERASLSRQRWLLFGMTMLLWACGMTALMAVPAPLPASGDAKSEESRQRTERPVEPPVTPRISVDLPATAQLCTDLSRVTATAALPALLDRAVSVLDASGIVLWMGAGEQLFAVTGHGYAPHVLARLGPIHRGESNAAAAAWRTGRLTTVSADGTSTGAVVAPMFGPNACIGVLAIEIRHGREQDPATQAVAVMIAAQLATAVSAWPAASSTEPLAEVPGLVAQDRAQHAAPDAGRAARSA